MVIPVGVRQIPPVVSIQALDVQLCMSAQRASRDGISLLVTIFLFTASLVKQLGRNVLHLRLSIVTASHIVLVGAMHDHVPLERFLTTEGLLADVAHEHWRLVDLAVLAHIRGV